MKTKTNGLLGIALSIASTVALAGSPDPSATAMLQKLKGLFSINWRQKNAARSQVK